MKIGLGIGFFLLVFMGYGQHRPEPFEEAGKAMMAFENERNLKDSLSAIYEGRWVLNFTYGQRFILPHNKSALPDTITFSDFTETRAFYGLGAGHFISDRWYTHASVDVMFLPRKQEITSISFGGNDGITAEGSGNGGIVFNIKLGAKYAIVDWGNTRFFGGLALGATQLVAKGGVGTFTLFNGTEQEIATRRRGFGFLQPNVSVSHRFNPGFMFESHVGYAFSPRSTPIGGVTSPGGIIASVSLQFFLNPRKE